MALPGWAIRSLVSQCHSLFATCGFCTQLLCLVLRDPGSFHEMAFEFNSLERNSLASDAADGKHGRGAKGERERA
jgi:hypothetical protein